MNIFLAAACQGINRPIRIQTLVVRRGARRSALIAALRSKSVICVNKRASLRCPRRFSVSGHRIDLRKGTLFSITNGQRHPFLVRARRIEVRILKAVFRMGDSMKDAFRLSMRHNGIGITLGGGGRRVCIGTNRTIALGARRLHFASCESSAQVTRC